MAIRIEIKKMYNDNLELRIGDLSGSIESTNLNKEEALGEISDQIDKLFVKNNLNKPKFYLSDLQNYTSEFLQEIILWYHEELGRLEGDKIKQRIKEIAIPFPEESLTEEELNEWFKENGESGDKFYLIPISKIGAKNE